MDLEHPNPSNEVAEEYDVFIKVPNRDLYMVQYPSRSTETALTKYETIESVKIQPEQRKLSMNIKIDPKCESFGPTTGGLSYDLESKTINNRTNYCIGKIENGALILIPVTTCVQMKKVFKDYEKRFEAPPTKGEEKDKTENKGDVTIPEINNQIKKKDNLKLLERKMRTHPFQQKVLEAEEPIPLRYLNQYSQDSSRLVQSLLDPPKDFTSLKPISRSQYLQYLF